MPRVASLYLPNFSTDRVRASEGRREALKSSPRFLGEGDHAKHGGGVLPESGRTPPPRSARSPSPANAGEELREPCSCPNESHWRPGARWARAKFTKKTSDSMNFVNF